MAKVPRGGAAREFSEHIRGVDRDSPAATANRLSSIARRVYHNDRELQLVLLVFMLLWYGALLWISWRLWWPVPSWNLTFNSLLDHLLQGRFDVDPQIIGGEGFLRDGRVYSYFGIWCALLRLPLWVFHGMSLDVTLWSCLAAACIAGVAKVRAALLVRRHAIRTPMIELAITLMLAYAVLGGSAVGALGASLVQEVILWAYAFAALFVYLALKGLINRHFDLKTLSWMACCAGLALLTRVSTGIGLILALVLLLLVLAAQHRWNKAKPSLAAMERQGVALTEKRMLAPLGILGAFVAATGIVNYGRWGNPATFANYDLYMLRTYFPGFVQTMHKYGPFNLLRIPFSLAYYFVPIWVLHGPSGQLFFESTRTHYFGDVELPPSSFFLTDLLPVCFIVLLAITLWRRRSRHLPPAGRWAAALAIGLLAPCILMLMLDWQAYRYRMEFYPEIDLLAFLGLYFAVTDMAALSSFTRWRQWITAGLAVSVVASLLAFSLDVLSGDGPPQEILRPGVVQYYSGQAAQHYHRAMTHFAGFPSQR
jgi:hypothetical protein